MKLDYLEVNRLHDYKHKIEKIIFGWGLGIPAIMFVLSFVPAGFLPHRNARRVSNPNESLIDMLGVFPTLLAVAIVAALLVGYFMRAYKYQGIKKDLLDKEKTQIRVNVSKLLQKEGPGPQEIDLSFAPAYNKINKLTFIDYKGFPRLYKGQEVILEFSNHAKFPLLIKPVNQISSKSEMEDLLKMFKNLKKDS